MRFLFWSVLAVVLMAARRRVNRSEYVPRHSYELNMDRLWTERISEMATYRRQFSHT